LIILSIGDNVKFFSLHALEIFFSIISLERDNFIESRAPYLIRLVGGGVIFVFSTAALLALLSFEVSLLLSSDFSVFTISLLSDFSAVIWEKKTRFYKKENVYYRNVGTL